MGVLDDIQARIDARMAEIDARVGGGVPGIRGEGHFDVSGVIRSLKASGFERGGGRKLGLCVGVEQVDPAAYGGVPQPCPGCGLDALDFSNVLAAAGFRADLLVNEGSSRTAVLGAMRRAADMLAAGDLFVMSVAGHGSREKVQGGNGPELHESWCLWDGKLVDDDIVAAVQAFSPGVRIVMINDQCHSGGFFDGGTPSAEGNRMWRTLGSVRAGLPMLIQFAACRADESSVGYPIGGTWTTALMKVLAADRQISWREWFDRAAKHPSLTDRQRPQWLEVGPVTEEFRQGRILT